MKAITDARARWQADQQITLRGSLLNFGEDLLFRVLSTILRPISTTLAEVVRIPVYFNDMTRATQMDTDPEIAEAVALMMIISEKGIGLRGPATSEEVAFIAALLRRS